ncbi:MAG: SRPBCC domain-containing protein [Verrucomicrobia bacterium]|nr:SRPBCC domain-containing protein [Verrucomicrobiota bacterium]
MKDTIRRELVLPQPREQVWQALTDRDALAEWMHPNDFEPRLGHRFTFRVPPKPEVNFDGLTVHCEVLECEPPSRLVFTWSAGGPVVDTRVTFELEADGAGTRLRFEHSGFDVHHPWADRAVAGANYGWGQMLDQLATLLARRA